MVRRLRIRRIQPIVPPDKLDRDVVERCGAPEPISERRFAAVVRFEPGLDIADERDPVAVTPGSDPVTFRLMDGEVRIAPFRESVLPVALSVARELGAVLVDAKGGRYIPGGPPVVRRTADVPVRPETAMDGTALAPDFYKSALGLGWAPIFLREPVVRRALRDRDDVALRMTDDGLMRITWKGHPLGVPVHGSVDELGRMSIAGPDAATARWLVEIAPQLGTICTDPHGVPWVPADTPAGIAPLFIGPDPGGCESNVHALLADAAVRAFDIEAGVLDAPVEKAPVRVPKKRAAPVSWWKRVLG